MMEEKKILIVDDEVKIVEFIQWQLDSVYPKIYTANSADGALEILKSDIIDVLVTDIKMPGMDGIELMRQALALHSDLQCIVITGHGDIDTAVEAMRLGAINYLSKPIGIEELGLAIDRGFERQHLIRSLREKQESLEKTNYELRNEIIDRRAVEQRQEIINSILKVSLLSITLKDQLEQILHLVMSISWISLQSSGAIYLCEENSDMLRLMAYHNLSEYQISRFQAIPFDKCQFGRSESKQDIIHSSKCDYAQICTRFMEIRPYTNYCIAIASNDRLLGVIHIFINASYKLNYDEEDFLKSIANTIAGIIMRKEAEEKIANNYMIQNVVNSILKLSIEPISITEQLEKTLDMLGSLSCFSPKITGCIFIIEKDKPDTLVMKAHRGFNPQLLKTCRRLPIVRCLCGHSALTGKIIFKSALDDTHEIHYDGIGKHGHYCVPIKSKEKVLGLINLYLNEGHVRTYLEETFLTSVANTLAGIIERKLAEDKIDYLDKLKRRLRKERDLFRTYLEIVGVMIVILDLKGNVSLINKRGCEVLGYREEEIIGKDWFDNFLPHRVRESVKRIYLQIISGGIAELEYVENQVLTKSGEERIIIWHNTIIKDENGDIINTLSSGEDITDLKATQQLLYEKSKELERLNQDLELRVQQETKRRFDSEQLLVQQSKMASMGEMITLIAHQWRQPLNAISAIIVDMSDAYECGDLNAQYIDRITKIIWEQVDFMSKTIDVFRDFLKPSKLKVNFDARKSLEEMLSMFEGLFSKANVALTIEDNDNSETYIASGYPNEFKQVILNMINNARDAILGRRQNVLQSGVVEDKITIRLAKNNGKIYISVKDNAGGIPDDILDKIFEPYFTTKSEEKGTGIGLYMSKTIIENNMAGRLTVKNIDGGAEFTIVI
ncbi:MAG: response regulator [Nitrospirae bacterium]|nr:response regulator [Nitrospirota bacterium]